MRDEKTSSRYVPILADFCGPRFAADRERRDLI